MVGGVGHAPRALAERAAQHADLVIGPKGGGQQAKGVERLDPLAVENVGLAARHALQLPRVHESDLEAAFAEELEEGDPVHANGLHRHGLDVAAGEPVGQGVQIRGEGPELSDVAPLGVTAVRDGDVVTPGADVDARGVLVDPAELGWKRGRAATAGRLRTGARHGGLLASGHRRGHAGRGGAAGRILPNGITPQGQAVTNDIGARLRDHAMKRAPRTTEGTVFSTRHVRADRTRSPQPEQRYFLLSGRGAAYDCSEVADPVKSFGSSCSSIRSFASRSRLGIREVQPLLFALVVASHARRRMNGVEGWGRHLRYGSRAATQAVQRAPPPIEPGEPQRPHRRAHSWVRLGGGRRAGHGCDPCGFVSGAVAKPRIEDPGQAPGQRDDGDEPATACRETLGPRAEGGGGGMPHARIDTAAWTSRERSRRWPALVIRPRRWPSPELHSRGTRPR